jgi:hypothetical protein
MPNLCDNYVVISGEPETIKLLADSFDKYIDHQNKPRVEVDRYISFTEFADTLLDQEFDRDNFDINQAYKYDTKWIDFRIQDQQEGEFTMNGTTAWSPPITFWLMLSEKYHLHIYTQFEEMGNDFGGSMEIDNGVIENDEEYCYMEWQYINDPSYFYDLVSDQLNDYDAINDYQTAQEFIKGYPYLNAEGRKILIDMFNALKREAEANGTK